MRKLIESTFVTLDGTISSPEKWGPPYWDSEHNAHAHKLLLGADTLLLGRETYEIFAQTWPAVDDEYGKRINGMPKYVASRGTPPSWMAS
ncbi:dihydrofolate reductase family protein [Saccharopolyspora shandongensis]|uniref:dihydrofolate reductase family protein n=1 Tax=Saccharopolyspora shandongensis TaxID=418495 RepID=UPI00341BCACD